MDASISVLATVSPRDVYSGAHELSAFQASHTDGAASGHARRPSTQG